MSNPTKITPVWQDSNEAPISFLVLFGKILATIASAPKDDGNLGWMAEVHALGARTTVDTRPQAKLWVETTIEHKRHETEDFLTIEGVCPVRSTPWSLRVRREAYDAWKGGKKPEEVFADLTASQRELLVSGLSPEGFQQTFGGPTPATEEGEVGGLD